MQVSTTILAKGPFEWLGEQGEAPFLIQPSAFAAIGYLLLYRVSMNLPSAKRKEMRKIRKINGRKSEKV